MKEYTWHISFGSVTISARADSVNEAKEKIKKKLDKRKLTLLIDHKNSFMGEWEL